MIKYRKFCIVALILVLVLIGVLFIVQPKNSKEVFDGTMVRKNSYFHLCEDIGEKI